MSADFRILEITGLPDFADYDCEYAEQLKRHTDDLSNCVKTIFSYSGNNIDANIEILLISSGHGDHVFL